MVSTAERRSSQRHAIALEVTLRLGGVGRSLQGKSADLSKSGIFVLLADPIPEGRRVDVLIAPGVLESAIATSGIVVHSVAGVGVGIRFSSQSTMTQKLIAELLEEIKLAAVTGDRGSTPR